MLVTPLPIVAEARLKQLLNARSPMLVTLLGIVMDVKLQLLNARSPMLVTLLGIVMEVRPVQYSNTLIVDNQVLMC